MATGQRERGDVSIPHTGKLGKRIERLAMQGTGTIRSVAEHRAALGVARRLLPHIGAKLAKLRHGAEASPSENIARRELATLARDLQPKLFGIALQVNGTTLFYYVSADVLVDWRRSYGDALSVIVKPPSRQHAKHARLTNAHNDALEETAEWRRNERGLGMAQNAYRYARLDGDADGIAFAEAWLWHGGLKPCRDRDCKQCRRDERSASLFAQRDARKAADALQRQHDALLTLASVHFDNSVEETRKGRKHAKPPHAMPSLPHDPTADRCERRLPDAKQCSESYVAACRRLGMTPRKR